MDVTVYIGRQTEGNCVCRAREGRSCGEEGSYSGEYTAAGGGP